MMRHRSLGWAAAVVSLALAGPALGQAKTEPAKSDPSIQDDLKHAKSLSRAFQHAASQINPSVVHITQERTVYTQRSFFDMPQKQMAPVGAGSGVIVSKDGYILTNNHVIEGAEKVSVKFGDGRELDGRVIGTDPPTDLGVIKVDADNLTPATFGDSDALEVGEWVIAVGSPFGVFDNTVTAGIVSAKGRTGLQSTSDEKNEDFIQTDAAINPGNSGGPLVNLEGKVVGINSQIASRSGGYQGIGFSIPSSIARLVMDQLVKTGRVDRGGIGLNDMATITPENAARVGFHGTEGVFVAQIVPNSPADKAGLVPGDIIVRFNGRPVTTKERLANAIAFTPPGTPVNIDYVRADQGRAVTVNVADRDDVVPGNRAHKLYGFTVHDVDPRLAQRMRVRGPVVDSIDTIGPAADAELHIGDTIVAVNGTQTLDAAAFDRAISKLDKARLRLSVSRGRQDGYIDIEPRQ
jgi:serine protease Do